MSETDLPQEGSTPSLKWEELADAGDIRGMNGLGHFAPGAEDFRRRAEGAGLKDKDRAIGGGGEAAFGAAGAD